MGDQTKGIFQNGSQRNKEKENMKEKLRDMDDQCRHFSSEF